MTIADLLRDLEVNKVRGSLGKEIKGIAYDSRLVKKGYLFVAVEGFSVDGHAYIKDAIRRGCVGVVVEKILDFQNETTVIEVEDSRKTLAFLSSAFYGEPSRKLSVIGITGTNGKTSTSYITRSIFETWGKKVGLLGTINYIIDRKVLTALNTTPESLDLQRYLKEMVESGVEYAVLEISSHALALHRVDGCSLKIAAFTNFSQDHLDFHGTMEEYFRAKSGIFDYLDEDGCAVLNWDDPVVRSLAGKLKCKFITCGLGEGAMVRGANITDGGLSFDIRTPQGSFALSSGLIGRNNVYNILMSVAVGYAIGISSDIIIEGVRVAQPVEGRFEKIHKGQEFLCIVDYAHTEDALRNLVKEARLVTTGKVITVFGCGGDRDRFKRPKMGAVASKLSDFVIITSDNPRTEEPLKIINEIITGITKENYRIVPDRATAIKEAVLMAHKGDTILIAGKGHENYQEINGIRYPFSDKEVVRRIIRDKI